MAERRLWFVRRNGEIKGPFISAQITRNILLGRLYPNDELSLDQEYWQQIAMHRELYPEVMQETPVNEESVNIAKLQVDERIAEQRRERQNMKEERRRTRDRRAHESDIALIHRQHRKETEDGLKNKLKRPKIPFLSLLLVVVAIIGFGFVLKPKDMALQADCAAVPVAGVNWSNCTFIELNVENKNLSFSTLSDAVINNSNLMGVNLSGSNMAYTEITASDLSYANLENTRLVGANLKNTDLRYASLKNADLSYADLSRSLLAGADFYNARFDNAIWVDGKKCKKESIGRCRL